MSARAKRWIGVAIDRLGLKAIARRAVRAVRASGIPTIRPSVLRAIAHDTGAHTQGLAYAGSPLRGLNDLEYLGKKIFACALWHTDIYEIDVQRGDVLRVVDCSEIVERSGRTGYRDVVNGIAFAPDLGTFFVTGKNWPTLFEVELAL